jgi:hypothetical protein
MALRGAKFIFMASALGELAVGILIAALPAAVGGLLLQVPVVGTAVVIGRMMGIALTAIGLTWWLERHRLDREQLRQLAPGFLLYNFGVGLLFLAYAWEGDRLLVPWLVAAVHLGAGAAFVAALTRLSSAAKTGSR